MSSKYILLVEDNPKDEKLTIRAIDKSGFANEVKIVRDGAEALDFLFCEGDWAKNKKDDLPTLLLLDLKMPKVDGFEVLRRVRADERLKHVPIVILSSSNEEKDVAKAYDLGANSYVRKPLDFGGLVNIFKQLRLYWVFINETPKKPKSGNE